MTRTEHLLVILAEECAEVAQRASKALRFGLAEVQPGQPLSNAERLAGEMGDLSAVWGMLRAVRAVPAMGAVGSPADKAEKVMKYLEYSAECGTLSGSASDPQAVGGNGWRETSKSGLADVPVKSITGGILPETRVRIDRGDWDAVDDLVQLFAELRAERDRLKLLTESLAERVWAQSELLSKSAERGELRAIVQKDGG